MWQHSFGAIGDHTIWRRVLESSFVKDDGKFWSPISSLYSGFRAKQGSKHKNHIKYWRDLIKNYFQGVLDYIHTVFCFTLASMLWLFSSRHLVFSIFNLMSTSMYQTHFTVAMNFTVRSFLQLYNTYLLTKKMSNEKISVEFYLFYL